MKPKSILSGFKPAFLFVMLLWIIFLTDLKFGLNLESYGLQPRTMKGLIGIITMPLLHGSFHHLINNSIPILVLMTLIFYFYNGLFYRVFTIIWILNGLWTWTLADSSSIHIGASGIIYGFAAFVFFSGIIIKNRRHIALSLLIVFLYGSMIWGIFPIDYSISWEGHLTGFFAGLTVAYFYRSELKAYYISDSNQTGDSDDNESEEDEENAPWKMEQ